MEGGREGWSEQELGMEEGRQRQAGRGVLRTIHGLYAVGSVSWRTNSRVTTDSCQ